MRFSVFPILFASALALGLSACANHPPIVPQASFIDRVDVELKQDVTSPTIAGMVASKTRRESTRYSRSGEAKHLRIAISRLHYKNALQSLLIGDANSIAAHVAVLDGATGKAHGEFDATVIDSGALNGVSGVMISMMQDKAEVDQRLAQSLASDVLERVYGSAVAKEARQRPILEIVQPAPAAAPVAPAKPKLAPAKVRKPKTAMVEGAALAR